MVMDRGLVWIGLAALLAALLLWAALDPSFALFGEADVPPTEDHGVLRGVDPAAEAQDAAGPTLAGRAREAAAAPSAPAGEPPPEGTPAGPRFLRVLDERGRPMAGAGVDWGFVTTVGAHEPDLDPARPFGEPMARTDARGHVAVPAWARKVNGGVYLVRPDGYLRAGGRIPRGNPAEVLTVRMQRVVVLTGTVRGPAGRPWSGAKVVVTHGPSGLSFTATTRADGRWNTAMLAGPVGLEVRAWNTQLATHEVHLAKESFDWPLTVDGARFICGVLHAPTAGPKARFDLELELEPRPAKPAGSEAGTAVGAVRVGRRTQDASGLRHGRWFRFRLPDGATGGRLVVHRRNPRVRIHTVETLAAGAVDVVVRLDAADLAEGAVRIEVSAPAGWSGVVQLQQGDHVVSEREVRGGSAQIVRFTDLPVQAEYTVRVGTYRAGTRRYDLVYAPRELHGLWSRAVRPRAGEVVDLGVVEIPD